MKERQRMKWGLLVAQLAEVPRYASDKFECLTSQLHVMLLFARP